MGWNLAYHCLSEKDYKPYYLWSVKCLRLKLIHKYTGDNSICQKEGIVSIDIAGSLLLVRLMQMNKDVSRKEVPGGLHHGVSKV